ncbi:acyltransferase family protein [Streptomyces sp. NPDC004111]|uniref:acyltransferase family protein n=1 Tax=Streptomyces sp. NPDC004111 TaxID=3364690 RepID=UPI0036CC8A19
MPAVPPPRALPPRPASADGLARAARPGTVHHLRGAGPDRGKRHIGPLDGLRGLAVAAVVFFHAGHFDGGFLGVDLFFVLSGFLITGLLLKEHGAHGRVDLVAFWGRRMRRLLPALGVTVAVSLLLVWAFGTVTMVRSALDDAPWVIADVANWHFIADQVGYWEAGETRVFSHLWSIAVEEQFYVLWPVILMLLLRVRGRRAKSMHGRVALAAAMGAVASLVLMIVLADPVDSTRVYEGTDTRAFSLLLGCLMATAPATRLLARLGDRAACWCAPALVCALGAYWVLADGQNSPSLFQGGLFLHALGAALLIGFLAQAPDSPVGRLLGCSVLRRLGALSYSLYLWHWPVFVLLNEERLGMTGWRRTAVIMAVSLGAALVSMYAVENPFRFRARWAHGRRGALALVVGVGLLFALWAAIPMPVLGEGAVDLTRLSAGR